MEIDSEAEESARALITYLRNEAFEFFFSRFNLRCALTDNVKTYDFVKKALK